MSNNMSAIMSSFWDLISEYSIEIPMIQRDYAQGRKNDDDIRQIREGLVNSLFNALQDEESPLMLNFVYGEIAEETANTKKFIPLDGQQRLTTLFLLHWYLFNVTSYSDAKNWDILKRFSYKTRASSVRFCENLCEIKEYKLSSKTKEFLEKRDAFSASIKNFTWFSKSYEADPTVESMLVMLDEIHNKFKNLDNSVLEKMREKLLVKTSMCPITFLWLRMENFKGTSDLYIKMNARGKELTDFEIFKAKYQDSDILETILRETDCSTNNEDITADKRVKYISRYNNEYTTLFYERFCAETVELLNGKKVLKIDQIIFNIIKSILRNAYLMMLDSNNVDVKEYQKDYVAINKLNGKLLFNMINNCSVTDDGKPKYPQFSGLAYASFKNALISIENLFNKLPSKKEGFPVPLNSVHYDEESIIKQFENIENITYKDNAVHYAIFKWISKFDVSNENAYNYWKRFVYNILNTAPFENHAHEIIRSAKMFSSILDGITEDVSKESVLRAIINYFDNNKDTIISIIKNQYEEETIKAKLILKSPDWERLILEAEEYFKDGQIVFILDLSKNDDNTYDLGKFEKALRKCKSVFNNKKEICDDKQKKLFEKSLLLRNILSDNKPSDGYAHLLSKAQSNGHRFPYGDYKSSLSIYLKNKDHKKYGLIIALLKAIIDSNLDFQETMNKYLMDNQNAIRNYNGWERHFIENDNLFSCEFTDSKTFSNYIQIVDDYVLMLSGTSIKSLSIELNTLLLFQSIKTHLPNARLSLNSDYALTDEFSFPRRYIVLQDYYVGYYNGEFIVFKENTQIKRFDCMQTCKEYLLSQG